jgi:hypothetical protein
MKYFEAITQLGIGLEEVYGMIVKEKPISFRKLVS